MKKNLQHIDEIRFLIIHFILINHSMLSFALIRNKVDQTLIDFWFEFTSPILAMISGYLFFYGSENHFGFMEKVRRRIPSLLIPYVLWSLGFFVIYFLFKEVAVNFFHYQVWYLELRPLTLQNVLHSLIVPPLVNFWYLQNLILIIPFNIIFFYILKHRIASYIFFLAILFIFAYNPFPIYFQPRFLPFYLMGCYFGYHEVHLPKYEAVIEVVRVRTRMLMSVIWVPLILFISLETGSIEYEGILRILLKIGIVLFLLIFFYNSLEADLNSWVFRYLKKYKPFSFFLFAIHTFIFSLVQRPLFKLFENLFVNKYFTLFFSLFTVVILLIIALFLGVFIKKKWPGFFGMITGR